MCCVHAVHPQLEVGTAPSALVLVANCSSGSLPAFQRLLQTQDYSEGADREDDALAASGAGPGSVTPWQGSVCNKPVFIASGAGGQQVRVQTTFFSIPRHHCVIPCRPLKQTLLPSRIGTHSLIRAVAL